MLGRVCSTATVSFAYRKERRPLSPGRPTARSSSGHPTRPCSCTTSRAGRSSGGSEGTVASSTVWTCKRGELGGVCLSVGVMTGLSECGRRAPRRRWRLWSWATPSHPYVCPLPLSLPRSQSLAGQMVGRRTVDLHRRRGQRRARLLPPRPRHFLHPPFARRHHHLPRPLPQLVPTPLLLHGLDAAPVVRPAVRTDTQRDESSTAPASREIVLRRTARVRGLAEEGVVESSCDKDGQQWEHDCSGRGRSSTDGVGCKHWRDLVQGECHSSLSLVSTDAVYSSRDTRGR